MAGRIYKRRKLQPHLQTDNFASGSHSGKGKLHGETKRNADQDLLDGQPQSKERKTGTSLAGNDGAIANVIIIARPSFTRFGTLRSLRIGAVEMSASTRSNGQKVQT